MGGAMVLRQMMDCRVRSTTAAATASTPPLVAQLPIGRRSGRRPALPLQRQQLKEVVARAQSGSAGNFDRRSRLLAFSSQRGSRKGGGWEKGRENAVSFAAGEVATEEARRWGGGRGQGEEKEEENMTAEVEVGVEERLPPELALRRRPRVANETSPSSTPLSNRPPRPPLRVSKRSIDPLILARSLQYTQPPRCTRGCVLTAGCGLVGLLTEMTLMFCRMPSAAPQGRSSQMTPAWGQEIGREKAGTEGSVKCKVGFGDGMVLVCAG
jgi:hypothetical protein